MTLAKKSFSFELLNLCFRMKSEILNKNFPFILQSNSVDCGPTCLKMVAKFFGIDFPIKSLSQKMNLSKEGVSLYDINKASKELGLFSKGVKLSFDSFQSIPLPCIIPWNNIHFVVVYEVSEYRIIYANPSIGLLSCSRESFIKNWSGDNSGQGVALIIWPPEKMKSSSKK